MKNFGVGMDKAVHAARRRLEDRIARIAFKKENRFEVPKPVMWEKIVTALELATDEELAKVVWALIITALDAQSDKTLKQIFGDGA